jgi:predicted AAA+ superfamily ATPase
MIERKEYLQKILSWKDKKVIKVVTGIRRCGKSTLLQMFRDNLKAGGVLDRQIQSFNFDSIENEQYLDYHVLYETIKQKLAKGKSNYIFLDEVQMVHEFQKAVISLFQLDTMLTFISLALTPICCRVK